MSAQDNGGPAFPFPSDCAAGEAGELGMFLRDYFAAAVLPACFERHASMDSNHLDANVAKRAYEIADAMLKARAQ